jgi:hypothetical protein
MTAKKKDVVLGVSLSGERAKVSGRYRISDKGADCVPPMVTVPDMATLRGTLIGIPVPRDDRASKKS